MFIRLVKDLRSAIKRSSCNGLYDRTTAKAHEYSECSEEEIEQLFKNLAERPSIRFLIKLDTRLHIVDDFFQEIYSTFQSEGDEHPDSSNVEASLVDSVPEIMIGIKMDLIIDGLKAYQKQKGITPDLDSLCRRKMGKHMIKTARKNIRVTRNNLVKSLLPFLN